MNDRLKLILLTAVAPSVWGSTYLVTTELLPPDRPLLAAVLRALPAGLLLLLITPGRPRGAWWGRAAVLGTLNIGAFFALLFLAAYRLPGGVAATVTSLQPLLVAGLAAVVLAERVRVRTAVAGVIGVVGVALLVLRADAALDTVGVLAAVGAAVSMATGVVLSKRWRSPVQVLTTTGWQLVAGGLLLVPVAALAERAPVTVDAEAVIGWAYLSLVGAALAYALWFRGLRSLPPTQVTFLGLLSPLVATVLGWVVLGQALTALQVLGAALVLVSVVAGQGGTSAGAGGAPRTAGDRASAAPAPTAATPTTASSLV